jgi:hypothetical protein
LAAIRDVREVALLDPLAVHAHSGGMLKSDRTIARANRKPLEAHVVSCFDALVRALGDLDRPAIDTRLDRQSWRHAFIESYFSNYIERTRVALSEAEEIVFDREVDESRHADSHDILAVYDIAVDTDGMINTPSTPGEFRYLLIRRHAFLMNDGPDTRPVWPYNTKTLAKARGEIFNTDQGCQFTSHLWAGGWKRNAVR